MNDSTYECNAPVGYVKGDGISEALERVKKAVERFSTETRRAFRDAHGDLSPDVLLKKEDMETVVWLNDSLQTAFDYAVLAALSCKDFYILYSKPDEEISKEAVDSAVERLNKIFKEADAAIVKCHDNAYWDVYGRYLDSKWALERQEAAERQERYQARMAIAQQCKQESKNRKAEKEAKEQAAARAQFKREKEEAAAAARRAAAEAEANRFHYWWEDKSQRDHSYEYNPVWWNNHIDHKDD